MDDRSQRIELQGEYDLANRETLAALFGSLKADLPVEIDVAKVTYIDSTVLQELAKLRIRLKGQAIKLRGCSESIRRLLHIVQFQNLFELVEGS